MAADAATAKCRLAGRVTMESQVCGSAQPPADEGFPAGAGAIHLVLPARATAAAAFAGAAASAAAAIAVCVLEGSAAAGAVGVRAAHGRRQQHHNSAHTSPLRSPHPKGVSPGCTSPLHPPPRESPASLHSHPATSFQPRVYASLEERRHRHHLPPNPTVPLLVAESVVEVAAVADATKYLVAPRRQWMGMQWRPQDSVAAAVGS